MANNDLAIQHVSDTALWVAVYRAQESERPDALFHDPFARRLAGERGFKIASRMSRTRYTAWSLSIRTIIIDHFIRELVAQGVDTVVNLGAGLDARPYRLDLPQNLRWVEADFPHMIDYKAQELRDEIPKVQLERVSLDLTNRVVRRDFFAKLGRESKKTLILTEGVIPYLSESDVADLADDLRTQPAFVYWIVDYFSPQVMPYIQKARRTQMMNAPFQFSPKDWYGFFSEHGWGQHEVRYLAEESLKRGRKVPQPLLARIFSLIMPPKKKREMQRFLAYVVLTPQ